MTTTSTTDEEPLVIPAEQPGQAPKRAGRAGTRVDAHTLYEISQFYFEEAALLDDGCFPEWLDLLAEDLVYWAPVRTNRTRRQQNLSVAKRGETAYYDETKDSLAWRIRRFDSGAAWAEDPSRTRHLISNVIARYVDPDEFPGLTEDEIAVQSAFLVFRSRLQHEQNLFSGRRNDVLRRDGRSFQVARREILLDHNVLQAKNISIFF